MLYLDSEIERVTCFTRNTNIDVKTRSPPFLSSRETCKYSFQYYSILIWNDVGLGAIMRASVDGTSLKELARATNATALTIDQATGTVYWAVNRQIHAVDLDSHNE